MSCCKYKNKGNCLVSVTRSIVDAIIVCCDCYLSLVVIVIQYRLVVIRIVN